MPIRRTISSPEICFCLQLAAINVNGPPPKLSTAPSRMFTSFPPQANVAVRSSHQFFETAPVIMSMEALISDHLVISSTGDVRLASPTDQRENEERMERLRHEFEQQRAGGPGRGDGSGGVLAERTSELMSSYQNCIFKADNEKALKGRIYSEDGSGDNTVRPRKPRTGPRSPGSPVRSGDSSMTPSSATENWYQYNTIQLRKLGKINCYPDFFEPSWSLHTPTGVSLTASQYNRRRGLALSSRATICPR